MKALLENRHFEKQGCKQKHMLQGETAAAKRRADYMHAQWEKDCESYNYYAMWKNKTSLKKKNREGSSMHSCLQEILQSVSVSPRNND